MTEPIHNQGNEGTCFAHAVSRCFNRFSRELGVALVPEVYQIVIKWAKEEFGKNGGDPLLVMKCLINNERNAPTNIVFPEDLLPHLYLRSVKIKFGETSSTTITKNDVTKLEKYECVSNYDSLHPVLTDAIRNHRSPVCAFYMRENQFEAFGRNTGRIITPNDIPAGNTSTKLSGHAVVLFRADETSGEIFFKNSWGEDWGRDGVFSVSSLRTLSPSPDNHSISFFDICFDSTIPPHYTNRPFRRNPERDLNAVAEVPLSAISYDPSVLISGCLASGVKVYGGKFRVGREIDVAVKVFPPMPASELNHLKELTFAIDHKNIVFLYGFTKTLIPGRVPLFYTVQLAMSWATQGSLTSLYNGIAGKNDIRLGGKLGWTRFFNIILDVCDALEFLQRLELVHGDFCSDNIVLSSDGTAKLTDFGTLSFTGTVAVSALGAHQRWASPEIKGGSKFLSHKTDVYGVGLLMEYLLDDSWETSGGKMSDNNSTELRSFGLENIIIDCKQTNPLDRPSADQLIEKIWDHLNSFKHHLTPIFTDSRAVVSRN